jgi:hypothetical protein
MHSGAVSPPGIGAKAGILAGAEAPRPGCAATPADAVSQTAAMSVAAQVEIDRMSCLLAVV